MTPRQARFVAEFLVDLNATRAAIRAGYSEKTAGAIGYENLSKPQITEAIATAQAKRAERVEITQDDVIAGLLTEARRTGDDSTHGARVSAWATLARHLGMTKLQHAGEITIRWAK